jgi:hypothetical protein
MKIKNQSLSERATRVVSLPREEGALTLRVRALPLGFEQKLLDWLPAPRPPRTYATGKGGKVLKDEHNRPVLEEDDRDPAYRSRARHHAMLQGVALLHESLKGDPEVEWETPEPPSDQGRAAFYEALYEELKAANFTSGDMASLLEAVTELSAVRVDVETTREGF